MQPLKERSNPGSYLARQRSRARALHGRVYATADGRLLSVRGKPRPDQMLQYLVHLDATKSHLITPADLGFPRPVLEELTESQLVSAALALTKWRRFSEVGPRSRQSHARQRADAHEISTLQLRLQQLYEWKRLAPTQGFAEQSPWLLDERQARQLDHIIHTAWQEDESTQRFSWLARLVFWIAGGRATIRFCQAINLIADESPESEARRLLRATLAKLDAWSKRAPLEGMRVIQQEMESWFSQLPPRLVTRAGLSAKLKGPSLSTRLGQQVLACQQSLHECSDGRVHRLAAALATIVANDNSIAPVPRRLIEYWRNQNHELSLRRITHDLLEESKRPGYDKLLRAIDQTTFPLLSKFDLVRHQLSLSQSIEDIEWALQSGMPIYSDTNVRVGWVRRLDRQLARSGIQLVKGQLNDLIDAATEIECPTVIDRFVDWTVSLPAEVRTPKVCQLLRGALLDIVLLAIQSLEARRSLRHWNQLAAPPRGSQASCVESWTNKLQAMQTAMGKTAGTPATVRKRLEAESSHARERAYLYRLAQQNLATKAQLTRLRYLETKRSSNSEKESRKALRSVRDTFVHVALESLRHTVRSSAEEDLGDLLTSRLLSAPIRRVMQFAKWRRDMTPGEQQLLECVMQSHRKYGPAYKQRLELNRKWLKAARSHGMDVQAWLEGSSSVEKVHGRRLTIAISTDPMDTFLMGSHFGTCLSLGRENHLAVLANAADANKQVIFVRDEQRRVQARQLISISDNYELLGYYCYVNECNEASDIRESIHAAVAAFCGRLARRCGVPLADEGEPEPLGEHFWYDDEPCTWHEAARLAMTPPVAATLQSPSPASSCCPVDVH